MIIREIEIRENDIQEIEVRENDIREIEVRENDIREIEFGILIGNRLQTCPLEWRKCGQKYCWPQDTR